jgi:hypothetical protein
MNLNNLLDLKSTEFNQLLQNYDHIVIRHTNLKIDDLQIFSTSIDDLNILVFKQKNNLFIYGFAELQYFLQNTTNTITEISDSGEIYVKETKVVPRSLTVESENKGYCFEIISDTYNKENLVLNFITTDKNVSCNINTKNCKPLNYLFNVIFKFLNLINYNLPFYLKDDSQIDNTSLLLFNILKGKDSIYCKYGFEYTKTGWYKLNKNKQKILNLRLFIESNYPDFKLDDKYRELLNLYFSENGVIDVQNIEMVCNNYNLIFDPNIPCKFESRCGNRFDFDCYINQTELTNFQVDKNYQAYVYYIINKILESFSLKLQSGKINKIDITIKKDKYFQDRFMRFKKLMVFLDVIGYKNTKNKILDELSNLYNENIIDLDTFTGLII